MIEPLAVPSPTRLRCPSGHLSSQGDDRYCVQCGRRLRTFLWSEHSRLRNTLVVVGLVVSISATVITAHWGSNAGPAALVVGIVLAVGFVCAVVFGLPIWIIVDGHRAKERAKTASYKARDAVAEAHRVHDQARRTWQTYIEALEAKPEGQRSQAEQDEYDTYTANLNLELAEDRYATVDALWRAGQESYGQWEIANRNVLIARATIRELVAAGRYRESVTEQAVKRGNAALTAALSSQATTEAENQSEAASRAARNIAISAGLIYASHQLGKNRTKKHGS